MAENAAEPVTYEVTVPIDQVIPPDVVPSLNGWEVRFADRSTVRVRTVDLDPIVRARAKELITFLRTRARLADARVKLPVGPAHTWPHGMSADHLNDLRIAVRVILQEEGETIASHDPMPTAWLVGPIIGTGTTKPRFTIGAPKPAD